MAAGVSKERRMGEVYPELVRGPSPLSQGCEVLGFLFCGAWDELDSESQGKGGLLLGKPRPSGK